MKGADAVDHATARRWCPGELGAAAGGADGPAWMEPRTAMLAEANEKPVMPYPVPKRAFRGSSAHVVKITTALEDITPP